MSDLANRLFTSDVQDADDAVGASGRFFALVALAIAVVFIIWQFRHAKNAERLAGPLPLGPVGRSAAGSSPSATSCCPSCSSYRSRCGLGSRCAASIGPGAGVVVVWWVLYVAGSVLVAVGRLMHPSNEDVNVFNLSGKADQFATADRVMAVGLLVMIAAAIAGLLMVRQLSERQARALSRPCERSRRTSNRRTQAQPQPYQQPQAPPPPPAAPPQPAPAAAVPAASDIAPARDFELLESRPGDPAELDGRDQQRMGGDDAHGEAVAAGALARELAAVAQRAARFRSVASPPSSPPSAARARRPARRGRAAAAPRRRSRRACRARPRRRRHDPRRGWRRRRRSRPTGPRRRPTPTRTRAFQAASVLGGTEAVARQAIGLRPRSVRTARST